MVSAIGKKLRTGFTLAIVIMSIVIFAEIVAMNNVLSNLKFSTQEQLGAAISTMDIRVNRLDRNLALKKIVLLGKNEEVLNANDTIFQERHKQMYNSIKEAAEPLTSKVINDSIREKFIDFYNEIQEFDRAKTIKNIYKNKGEEFAIKEIREDRDKAGILLNEIVGDLKRQSNTLSDQYQNRAKTFVSVFFIVTFVGLFISIVIAFLTIKQVTKSITSIHRTVAKIYGGDWDLPIEVHSQDEFSGLAEAFDRMRKSLLGAKKLLDRKMR